MAGQTTPPPIDLSTDQGYSIAAAIRGPDFQTDSEAIKSVFTARTRWLAGARDMTRYNTRQWPIATSVAKDLRKERQQCKTAIRCAALYHYLVHIESAAFALEDKKLADLASRFRIGGAGIEETVLSNERIIELAGGD